MANWKFANIFQRSTTPILMLLSIGFLLGQLGCVATKVELPGKYNPSYAYSPTAVQGGEAISIALLEPHFEEQEVSEIDRAFQSALERALLNYFTTNNFSVSGPFKSMDVMTFPEKKQTNLVLETTLAYYGDFPQIYKEGHTSSWDGSTTYSYQASGSCSMTGVISFTLWEPLSQQRMWTKEVPVPRDSVDCTFEETKSSDLVNRIWWNAGAKLIEELFGETMHQVERYFHPDEVRLVNEQAQELRDRKVY